MNVNSLHRRGAEDAEFPQREITEKILAAAFEVHTLLGAGLLETVYQRALAHELVLRQLAVAQQVAVPVQYKEVSLGVPLRLDLVVEGQVVVEVKAIAQLDEIHQAQLLTYLRLSGLSAGLLINFNVPSLRLGGIKRVVNTLRTSAPSVPLR
ncbi:MAG TPA: GxxExxY protein [Rubrivivax sp.]|nr:GxxExxY protein [Rubrivivax sp.]